MVLHDAPMTALSRLIEARDAGARYLLGRQREDGLIGEPDWGMAAYYKAVWAFTAAGHTAAASRLLAWVRAHNFDPGTGDFRGEHPRGQALEAVYPYPNAWLAIGAQKLGAFDIARRAADFIVTLQDTATGGFRARPEQGGDSPQDVLSSAQAGLACLFTGRLGNARFTAHFLRTVMEEQPEPETKLYFVWQRDGLRLDFKPDHEKFFVLHAGQPLQPYLQIGIAAAFLSRMAMASGETSNVELARRYLEPAFRATSAMYQTAQAGKAGWGAALVHQLTGEDRYRGLAFRVAEALCAQQNPDGSWHNTGGFTHEAVTEEVTAEFVVLLGDMAGALASR
jgi:hypothetical protein